MNVHESTLSWKLLFERVIENMQQNTIFTLNFDEFLHTVYKYVANSVVNDVCQVFQILYHYTWGGGRFCGHTVYVLYWDKELQNSQLIRIVSQGSIMGPDKIDVGVL